MRSSNTCFDDTEGEVGEQFVARRSCCNGAMPVVEGQERAERRLADPERRPCREVVAAPRLVITPALALGKSADARSPHQHGLNVFEELVALLRVVGEHLVERRPARWKVASSRTRRPWRAGCSPGGPLQRKPVVILPYLSLCSICCGRTLQPVTDPRDPIYFVIFLGVKVRCDRAIMRARIHCSGVPERKRRDELQNCRAVRTGL